MTGVQTCALPIWHHIRWYIRPRILVGNEMPLPYRTKHVLVFGNPALAERLGRVIYEDETLSVVENSAILPPS